ncbi:MAG: hypothetical protein Q9221_002716 [Calogaya cf. arnoldii]
MAEAAEQRIPSDASSITTPKAQNIPTFVSPAGKPCSTDFLKPDSPRKRRWSGESLEPVPISPKFPVSPQTLSAAQALIDQRKQKQAQETISGRETSPNPAIAVISALQGRQMVSERNRENVLSSPSGGVGMSEPIAAAATSVQKPEASRAEVAQMQRSVTPSSGLVPGEEGSAPTMVEGSGISVASPARIEESMGNDEGVSARRDVHQPRRQETDPGEGLVYTGEASHEPEKMDEEADAGTSRKGSLPSIQRHEAPKYSGSDGHTSYTARQPSTYPPIIGRQPNPGGLYPPMASPGAGSSTSNSPRQTAFGQSSGGSNFPPPPPTQNVFAQGGGMTESPKPLSPGSHQLGHPEPSTHRNRSPSLTQQYQQQQFGRKLSMQSTSSAMSLPPMPPSGHSGAPHLPSLPGLPPPDLMFTLHSQTGGAPPVHPSAQGSGPTATSPSYQSPSGNNSLSSQSGDGSQKLYGSDQSQIFAYIKSLEVKIDRLQEEVGTLKNQLSASR